MIDASPSLEAAAGISGKHLLAYLDTEGWISRPSKVDGVMIATKGIPGTHERAELVVPLKAGHNDEQRRVADALRTIAQIEGCSELQIANKVRQWVSESFVGRVIPDAHAPEADDVDFFARYENLAFLVSVKRTRIRTNNDIEVMAQQLREFLGLSDESVFNIVDLLENDMPKALRNFRVEVFAKNEAQEIYSTKTPPRIFVNEHIYDLARQDDAKLRVVFAKELAHIILDHFRSAAHFRGAGQSKVVKDIQHMEGEASQFALAFLIPSTVAHGFNDPKLLSLYCKVDRGAAEMRMHNIREREAEIIKQLQSEINRQDSN